MKSSKEQLEVFTKEEDLILGRDSFDSHQPNEKTVSRDVTLSIELYESMIEKERSLKNIALESLQATQIELEEMKRESVENSIHSSNQLERVLEIEKK